MMFRSKFVGALAGAALIAVSATPASAQGRYRWHHRHDDGVNAGTVIGVLAAVGIFAAIASAASNDRRSRDGGYDNRPYDDRPYDDRNYDDRGYDNNRPYDDQGSQDSGSYGYDSRSAGDDGYVGAGADPAGEDIAANACAIAARDQSARNGGFAEVRSITAVRPFGTGYDVTGTLDQRSSYRASDGRLRSFRCIWDNGQVGSVSFN